MCQHNFNSSLHIVQAPALAYDGQTLLGIAVELAEFKKEVKEEFVEVKEMMATKKDIGDLKDLVEAMAKQVADMAAQMNASNLGPAGAGPAAGEEEEEEEEAGEAAAGPSETAQAPGKRSTLKFLRETAGGVASGVASSLKRGAKRLTSGNGFSNSRGGSKQRVGGSPPKDTDPVGGAGGWS
eukprot:jgi/Botrbrau1/12878/Bobra.0188s0020.1